MILFKLLSSVSPVWWMFFHALLLDYTFDDIIQPRLGNQHISLPQFSIQCGIIIIAILVSFSHFFFLLLLLLLGFDQKPNFSKINNYNLIDSSTEYPNTSKIFFCYYFYYFFPISVPNFSQPFPLQPS